ncbi:hypothetical protein EYF80_048930 [Liparis tanakae]|uniref:Uncharacterized protein n=1 Tax=Liparis tanakae TaxID=230148 RepID=A0A4Z2FJF9_9TELE|nr:hypothetical protein EYF80_048930 [Liparis tanakae]
MHFRSLLVHLRERERADAWLRYFLEISSSSVCCSSSLVSWARRVSDASTSWMVSRLLVAAGNDLLSSKNILTLLCSATVAQSLRNSRKRQSLCWGSHSWTDSGLPLAEGEDGAGLPEPPAFVAEGSRGAEET